MELRASQRFSTPSQQGNSREFPKLADSPARVVYVLYGEAASLLAAGLFLDRATIAINGGDYVEQEIPDQRGGHGHWHPGAGR